MASSSNPNSSTDMSKMELPPSLQKADEQNYANPTVDSKKMRRIISNRLSAQKARLRKSKYVNDMEKTAKHLEDMILGLTSQMEDCKKNMALLMAQNQSLQALLEFRLNEARISEMEVEKNQIEVNRLKELQLRLSMNRPLMHNRSFMPLVRPQNHVSLAPYQNALQMPQAPRLLPPLPPPLFMQRNPTGEAEAADQYLNFEG